MIDNKRRAVKESQAVNYPDMVLLRETIQPLNVQLHYTPQEAIEVGRELVDVGSKLLARQQMEDPYKTKDPTDPRSSSE